MINNNCRHNHLGGLRTIDRESDEMQFRERKSNNLRNLMRIGKRALLDTTDDSSSNDDNGSSFYGSNAIPLHSGGGRSVKPVGSVFSARAFRYYRPQSSFWF